MPLALALLFSRLSSARPLELLLLAVAITLAIIAGVRGARPRWLWITVLTISAVLLLSALLVLVLTVLRGISGAS